MTCARAEERRARRARLASLTEGEHEVMQRVAAGKLNKVIADELHVSVRTVEVHRARGVREAGGAVGCGGGDGAGSISTLYVASPIKNEHRTVNIFSEGLMPMICKAITGVGQSRFRLLTIRSFVKYLYISETVELHHRILNSSI